MVACSGRSRAGLFVEVLYVPSRLKALVHHLNPWLLPLVGSGARMQPVSFFGILFS